MTNRLSALAAIFMLAAAPVPVMAQTVAVPMIMETITPQKIQQDMRDMKNMSYSQLHNAIYQLGQTIRGNETLTRAVIEALPQFLTETKDSWKWNHAHLMLQSFMQSNPGGYDADIDRAFTKFLTDYARDTIGVKGSDLENRLYNIAILSKTPALEDLQIDSLANVLDQGDFMTWVHVLSAYNTINEKNAGRHDAHINKLLEPSLDEFIKLLPDEKSRYGSSLIIGKMGQITPGLALSAVQALLPYAHDANPKVQYTIIESLHNIGGKHSHTTQIAFDALAQLSLNIDKPYMDSEDQYYTILGIYYLAKDDLQRADHALTLLQQIAIKLPDSDAVRHIANLAKSQPLVRERAIDTLMDCITYKINPEDAAEGLIDIARDDAGTAITAMESMNDFLLANPGNYDTARNLAYLAKYHGDLAPAILKTFQTLADQESPVLEDEQVRISIWQIAITHETTMPAISAIFERTAATLVKRKDWEKVWIIAIQLEQLQEMTEKYNQSLQKKPRNPAPSP